MRKHLTYANVMATLAVVLVVAGGTAYAANTVFSTDIVDGQVNSADVKDQSLTTFDVSTFLGADIVDGTITGDDVDESTLNLTEAIHFIPASGAGGFANGWGNDPDVTSPGGYWKDQTGIVHLRGIVGRLADMSGPTIFTLPAGYRPSTVELFPVATPTGVFAEIQVGTNGQVQAYSGTGSDVSLSGITFRP